jgi:hypothetical protein
MAPDTCAEVEVSTSSPDVKEEQIQNEVEGNNEVKEVSYVGNTESHHEAVCATCCVSLVRLKVIAMRQSVRPAGVSLVRLQVIAMRRSVRPAVLALSGYR